MSRDEMIKTLIEYVGEAFNEDSTGMDENTDITGRKSLQVITLTSMIENEFDVTIGVSKFDGYKTIGGLVDYIIEEQ